LGGQLAEGWRQMPRKLEPDLSPSKLWLIRHYIHGPEMSISPYATGTRESQKKTQGKHVPRVSKPETHGDTYTGAITRGSQYSPCVL
jgi:hypothetical protein